MDTCGLHFWIKMNSARGQFVSCKWSFLLAHRSWIFWESGHLKLHWFQWLSLNFELWQQLQATGTFFYLQLTINYEIRLFSMSKSVRKGVKCETDMRPAQTNSEMFFVFTFITYGASWYHEEGSLWYIYFRFIDVPKWEKNILGCNSLVRSVGPHF